MTTMSETPTREPSDHGSGGKTPLIELKDVGKSYGNIIALSGINLRVGAGEVGERHVVPPDQRVRRADQEVERLVVERRAVAGCAVVGLRVVGHAVSHLGWHGGAVRQGLSSTRVSRFGYGEPHRRASRGRPLPWEAGPLNHEGRARPGGAAGPCSWDMLR